MKTILIQKNDSGQRLDKFLTKSMPSLPRSLLYKGLRKNCVRLNGRHAKDGSVILREGDELTLYFKDEFFSKAAPKTSDRPLSVVYEDQDLLIVDKPPGLVVHADDMGTEDTLIGRVLSYLIKKGEYSPQSENSFTPALANRLDRNTGGLVIAAKNAAALRGINELIRERRIGKFYLCLAEGHFQKKSGTLAGWLLRGDKSVKIFDKPVPGTKNVLSSYRVISELGADSLVEVELSTGRTHQIRAQLAHIGHPLSGDVKYGAKKAPGLSHQTLYCYKLVFSECGKLFPGLDGRCISLDPRQLLINKLI